MIYQLNPEDIIAASKQNVREYANFVRHAPKILRDSMMLAYQTAVDDLLKAMDKCRIEDPVDHGKRPGVVLLDQNGNAT